MPKQETMAELAAAAEMLNAKTDQLNALIDDFEEALEKTNVGVTVWLEGMICEKPLGRTDVQGYAIGYERCDGKWKVTVRAEGRNAEGETTMAAPVIALSSAPRIVRVEAVKRFEELAQNLTAKAKEYAVSIDAATSAARESAR